MEAGLLAVGHASLKLAPLAGMEHRELLQIVDLKTDDEHRNQGEATKLMEEVCRRADLSNFLLILTPEPRSLEGFYEKFGFKKIQDKPSFIMCRDPKRKVWNIDTDEVSEVGGH